MPTELVTGAVTVRADPGAQLSRLRDQLLTRHFFDILVHGTSVAFAVFTHTCGLLALEQYSTALYSSAL
jgi:hypothetical protein